MRRGALTQRCLITQAVAYCKSEGVDISKLALHFTLREEKIATTLISSTSLTRMQVPRSSPQPAACLCVACWV